jgi:hypothetical protein
MHRIDGTALEHDREFGYGRTARTAAIDVYRNGFERGGLR